MQSSYTYDALNRLTHCGSNKNGALSSYTYTLGAAGNRLTVAELSGRQVGYGYDNLYRLTSETISNDPVAPNNGIVSYTYDNVGNRLSRTASIAPLQNQNFSYDLNDRLNSDQYDSNGNTTNSDGVVYSYDFENRIVSNNAGVTIVYDGDGNRVSKSVNGIVTKFLVDTNNLTGYAQVFEELDGANAVTRVYTYGLDLISQDQFIGAVPTQSFYGYDGHGSTRFLTNDLGAITDTYDYDAFGNLIAQTGTTPNLYRYCGEQFDAELGFYYLRARYMNQSTGRFMSMDDWEGGRTDPAALHKYLYCGADPINHSDPTGRLKLPEVLTVGAILGTLISSASVQVLTLAVAAVGTALLVATVGALSLGFATYYVYEETEKLLNDIASGVAVAADALIRHTPYSPTHRELRERDKSKERDNYQSHHIIQDAAAETGPAIEGRPSYDYFAAPAVLLRGPANVPGTPHNRATQAQRTSRHWGTYAEERIVADEALVAAGIPRVEIIGHLGRADLYFKGILGWKDTTRIPYRR